MDVRAGGKWPPRQSGGWVGGSPKQTGAQPRRMEAGGRGMAPPQRQKVVDHFQSSCPKCS